MSFEDPIDDNHYNNNNDNNNEGVPPIPKRPLTAYNIFSIMERHYILQQSQKSPLAEGEPLPDEEHDPYYSTRPLRYRKVLLPPDWYVVGKNRTKRQHHKNHGVVSFKSLSKMISTAWGEADAATKAYCKMISTRELEKYREEQKLFKEKYGEEAYDAQTRKRKNAEMAAELAAQGFTKDKKNEKKDKKQKIEDGEGKAEAKKPEPELIAVEGGLTDMCEPEMKVSSMMVTERDLKVEGKEFTQPATEVEAEEQDVEIQNELRTQENRIRALLAAQEEQYRTLAMRRAMLSTQDDQRRYARAMNLRALLAAQYDQYGQGLGSLGGLGRGRGRGLSSLDMQGLYGSPIMSQILSRVQDPLGSLSFPSHAQSLSRPSQLLDQLVSSSAVRPNQSSQPYAFSETINNSTSGLGAGSLSNLESSPWLGAGNLSNLESSSWLGARNVANLESSSWLGAGNQANLGSLSRVGTGNQSNFGSSSRLGAVGQSNLGSSSMQGIGSQSDLNSTEVYEMPSLARKVIPEDEEKKNDEKSAVMALLSLQPTKEDKSGDNVSI